MPDAITIPTGYEPKANDKEGNNQEPNCLLFILHVSAPPYIYFNYGFIINEKEVSDVTKLTMKVNDLQKENAALRSELNNATFTIQSYQQRFVQLEESLRRLETKLDEKVIDLPLRNNWVRDNEGESKPLAIKIGNVVHLKGCIKNGTSGTIAVLPHGWRPDVIVRFAQLTGSGKKTVHIRIDAQGNVTQNSDFDAWLCLDGIYFVVK